MNDTNVLAQLNVYVTAAAQLLNLQLGDARTASVALQLSRTLAMAQLLEAFPMTAGDELAETYCPAPFPAVVDEQGGL